MEITTGWMRGLGQAPAARPADVVRAAAVTAPDLTVFGIGPRQAKAGAALVAASLERHGLRLISNRGADDAALLLRDGGRFHTMRDFAATHPSAPPEVLTQIAAEVERRGAREQLLGTFGEGDLAGATAYATVHVGDDVEPARIFDDILARVKAHAPRTSAPLGGLYQLGGQSTSIDLKPAVAWRSTFLPVDTFIAPVKPRAVEQLPYVLYGTLGAMAQKEGYDLPQLVRQHPDLVDRLLRSQLMEIDYAEAQLRGPALEDADAVRIMPATSWPRGYLPADGPWHTPRDAENVVRELAPGRGLPVVELPSREA